MNSLLILTLFDYHYFKNSRIHHLANHLKERFDSVTIVFKEHIPHEAPLSEKMKKFFLFSRKKFKYDGIQMFRINPFLNHAEALGFSLTGQHKNRQEKRHLVRQAIWKFLGLMGFMSEISIILSFLLSHLFFVRRRFDVFIGQGPLETAVGYILQRVGIIRLLVYDDVDYVAGYSPHAVRRFFLDRLERYLIKRSDLVFSVGPFLAKLREAQTGRKVLVIPNGVDYELFKEARIKIPHPPTLLYMGFVEEWSGLEIVLEAMKELGKKLPGVRLLVLGHTTPHYLSKLERLTEELGIRASFFYRGNVPYRELVTYLKEADIGLAVFKPIDLRKYAFSLKVIEYMAAGLPVIATLGTQSASVVEQYSCGAKVAYDAETVCQCIAAMLENQEQYRFLSENAGAASKDFGWKELMERTYTAIETVYRTKYPESQ